VSAIKEQHARDIAHNREVWKKRKSDEAIRDVDLWKEREGKLLETINRLSDANLAAGKTLVFDMVKLLREEHKVSKLEESEAESRESIESNLKASIMGEIKTIVAAICKAQFELFSKGRRKIDSEKETPSRDLYTNFEEVDFNSESETTLKLHSSSGSRTEKKCHQDSNQYRQGYNKYGNRIIK